MSLDVSVVIPTYNRRAELLACLDRLAAQTLPQGRFEVVVVSDGSTDGTAEAAREQGQALGLDLSVLEGEHEGPGAARNLGVARARGSVIAFVDDDVRVDAGWLAAGLRPFGDSAVGGVEGRTDAELGPDSLYWFNVSNTAGGQYPTCNIFYRKSVFDEIGGFDTRFTRAREDSDLAFRVLDAGHDIEFEPAARVSHRSHHDSPLIPLFIASTQPDSVLLWRKHPGRDDLRAQVYPSDLAKTALAVGALLALATGHPGSAFGFGLGFSMLVGRTMAREVIWSRCLRPELLFGLLAAYTLQPFANLFWLIVGHWRVGRGTPPTRPV